jgi:flavin-dependent dehydrogenase
VLMTQRRRLDAFLAEAAVRAGAEFRDGVRVSQVAVDAGGVAVDGVRADALIGADGANGVVARSLGLCPDPIYGVALEGNLPLAETTPEHYRGRIVFDLGTVRGGYGWVFAKYDHVNLGVGGRSSEGPRLRAHLARFCAAHGTSTDRLRDVRGHRLPVARPGVPLACGRALVCGDAAGLVDPLSGDGMYEAFTSARLAADAILAGDLAPYPAALAQRLDHHAGASWSAKRALDRHPAVCFWAARSPGVFGVVSGLLRGQVGHPNEARGLARPPLRLVARVARRV